MCPHGYYTLLRESRDPRYLRLRLVQYAKQQGVKPAARAFDVQPRIVRKWCDRYDGTLASLQDQSRAPKHRPNKTAPRAETARAGGQVAAQEVPDQTLPESEIQNPTKLLGLPTVQYTARDVSTGALFLGYADEVALTYADVRTAKTPRGVPTQDSAPSSWRPWRLGGYLPILPERQRQRVHRQLAGHTRQRLHASRPGRRQHPPHHCYSAKRCVARARRDSTASRPTSKPSTA